MENKIPRRNRRRTNKRNGFIYTCRSKCWRRWIILVKWIEDEIIRISGAETICLMIKGWHGTWKKYFEDNMRPHVHSSFIVDGAKLYAFEKDNKIKFQIKNDEITHYTHAKRAPK